MTRGAYVITEDLPEIRRDWFLKLPEHFEAVRHAAITEGDFSGFVALDGDGIDETLFFLDLLFPVIRSGQVDALTSMAPKIKRPTDDEIEWLGWSVARSFSPSLEELHAAGIPAIDLPNGERVFEVTSSSSLLVADAVSPMALVGRVVAWNRRREMASVA
jgi:hypothetical protein